MPVSVRRWLGLLFGILNVLSFFLLFLSLHKDLLRCQKNFSNFRMQRPVLTKSWHGDCSKIFKRVELFTLSKLLLLPYLLLEVFLVFPVDLTVFSHDFNTVLE